MSRIKDAIDELASDANRQRIRSEITVTDAEEFVDSELAAEWIGRETGRRSPHSVLNEAIIEPLSDANAIGFLAAASAAFSTTAQHERLGRKVAEMLRAYIADDLRGDAEAACDKLEADGPSGDDNLYNAYFSVPRDHDDDRSRLHARINGGA